MRILQCLLVTIAVSSPSTLWAETKTSGKTVIDLRVDPTPPAANQEAVIIVTFTDAKSGKPVTVSEPVIVWSMPEMGHDWQTQKLTEGKARSYSAPLKFPMAGKYRASVSAKRGGVSIEAQYDFQVSATNHQGRGH